MCYKIGGVFKLANYSSKIVFKAATDCLCASHFTFTSGLYWRQWKIGDRPLFIMKLQYVEYKKRGLYPIFSCARDLAANVFGHGEI